VRAQATYDLGLTCIRLGKHDAALAAFDACERSLRQGSSMGPTPDEAVSPSLGRALAAFAAGDPEKVLTYLDLARREAPRSSYVEMFGGMVASLDGNDASAVRALDAALRRAPVYAELDGWLGGTYLRLGERALATGAAAEDTAETFERAVNFAQRAADRESRADKLAYKARLRECLVRIGAAHLPSRQRYANALAAAEKVLAVSELREQPAALALSGYCNYQLGRYDECLRRFQAVLDVVPDTEGAEWKGWRDYAGGALDAVKHWRSLEEKIVAFKSVTLDRQWETDEKHGVNVRVDPETGKLWFTGVAKDDGSINDGQVGPSVELVNKDLFARDTFERVTLNLRIPRQDRRGEAVNNVVFGVQVEVAGRRSGSGAKNPGIGVFYDKAKISVRIGGGQDKTFKEGLMVRLDPEQMWPGDEEIVVRIEREDEEKGTMAVYLNDQLVVRDNVSGFKRSRGAAQLWLGGAATQAQTFDVWVSDIRVVRRR
jgi:tetratricopeptide (TPR) repeat protein